MSLEECNKAEGGLYIFDGFDRSVLALTISGGNLTKSWFEMLLFCSHLGNWQNLGIQRLELILQFSNFLTGSTVAISASDRVVECIQICPIKLGSDPLYSVLDKSRSH
jgi:hypothetical protein